MLYVYSQGPTEIGPSTAVYSEIEYVLNHKN